MNQGISIIKGLYTGFLITKIENSYNNKSSDCFEPIYNINLELPENSKTIYDCLDHYCCIEELKDYKDKDLPLDTKFTKTVRFISLPEYLIIVLKRFQNDGRFLSKNNKQLEYPLVLNLNKYTYGYINNKNYEYNLNGIVFHQGGLNGGHYFSVVKSNDDWIFAMMIIQIRLII